MNTSISDRYKQVFKIIYSFPELNLPEYDSPKVYPFTAQALKIIDEVKEYLKLKDNQYFRVTLIGRLGTEERLKCRGYQSSVGSALSYYGKYDSNLSEITVPLKVTVQTIKRVVIYLFCKDSIRNVEWFSRFVTEAKDFYGLNHYETQHYYREEYVDCEIFPEEVLIIVTDEKWMETVCEKESHKANKIFIIAGTKNEKAIELQKRYGERLIPVIRYELSGIDKIHYFEGICKETKELDS
jgi:hypothetical protein